MGGNWYFYTQYISSPKYGNEDQVKENTEL